MLLIIGAIIVVGAVLGGFSMAGGHVMALWHLSEVVTIGGATLGAAIMMSSTKMLKDLVFATIQALKGSPFNRKTYSELFKLTYELLRIARRDGLLALEPHLNDPHSSAIFNKYPKIAHNHHVVTFICDGFTPLIEGSANAEQLEALMEADLHVLEHEHHEAIGVLQKAADGLPGFGIVAAVLGIVITMEAISGPVEEIGHKVGAALVGTFLGILASYGFLAPLATRLDSLGAAEVGFFRTISAIILASAHDCTPKVAIEQARRGVSTEYRPSRAELETLFKEAESG